MPNKVEELNMQKDFKRKNNKPGSVGTTVEELKAVKDAKKAVKSD